MQQANSFLERYTIQRKLENSDETVLKDKLTNNFVLMKELGLGSQEFKKVVETLEAQKGLRHEHLLSLLEYYTLGECSEDGVASHKVVTFFEYSTHSLLQEVEARYAESRLFEESEVWSILCSSVLGLAYLQKESIGHGCVSPIDIFVAPDGTVKVVDPSIATSSPFNLLEGYYYSPEIMEFFKQSEPVATEDIDIFKSDVFSLGLCVLHAALLESADDCFDYGACAIDYAALQNKLAVLSEHYSQELTNVLLAMLNEFPDSRPDFLELEDMLTSMTDADSLRSSLAPQDELGRPGLASSAASLGRRSLASEIASKLSAQEPHRPAPLEPDASDVASDLAGVPQTQDLDGWAVDESEDSAAKEDTVRDFMARHIILAAKEVRRQTLRDEAGDRISLRIEDSSRPSSELTEGKSSMGMPDPKPQTGPSFSFTPEQAQVRYQFPAGPSREEPVPLPPPAVQVKPQPATQYPERRLPNYKQPQKADLVESQPQVQPPAPAQAPPPPCQPQIQAPPLHPGPQLLAPPPEYKPSVQFQRKEQIQQQLQHLKQQTQLKEQSAQQVQPSFPKSEQSHLQAPK